MHGLPKDDEASQLLEWLRPSLIIHKSDWLGPGQAALHMEELGLSSFKLPR